MSQNDDINNIPGLPDFLDGSDLADLDNQLVNGMDEGDLLDRMQAQQGKLSERLSNFKGDFNRHKFLYILLFVSGFLSGFTGLWLGLAPELMSNPDGSTYIHFHTGLGNVIIAMAYMCIFPLVTEVAFKVAYDKFNQRESNNSGQSIPMLLAMVVGGLAILGTGVSGAWIIASSLGFLDKFAQIPSGVQDWLVWVIPSLIVFYVAMYVWYYSASQFEKAQRFVRDLEKKSALKNQLRQAVINQKAKDKVQAAAISLYAQMVMRGVISQDEADLAINNRMSLAQLEKRLGRDLTGGDGIGNVDNLSRSMSRPAPANSTTTHSRRVTPPVLQSSPIVASDNELPWPCPKCGNVNSAMSDNCVNCGISRVQAVHMVMQEVEKNRNNGNGAKGF